MLILFTFFFVFFENSLKNNNEKKKKKKNQVTGVAVEKENTKKEATAKKDHKPKPKAKQTTSTEVKKASPRKKKSDISLLHPSILELGERYRNYSIIGGNARCIALMQCISQMVNDYTSTSDKVLFLFIPKKKKKKKKTFFLCRDIF